MIILYYLLPYFAFVYFSAMGYYCMVHKTNPDKLETGAVLGFIMIVCSFCQVLGACEVNTFIVHGDHLIVYSKFLEWTMCTPLWCFLIMDSYGVDPVNTAQAMLYSLSFCVDGFAAALANHLWLKIWLTCQGCLSCSIVLYILWVVAKHPPKQSRIAWSNLVLTSLTYPLMTLTWGLGPDVFGVLSHKNEFILETCISLFMKSVALSYTLSEEEFSHINEIPSAIFAVARGVLFNLPH